ncbi:NUDIX hydrolase [Legionella israelensis]|uniref:MutT/nudix family transporter protein n=1 Tax=Legionella israelensis TaxID=454 RepID=A0A0W0V3M7_9GAMM|nr:CoA pyrophosphatase [Legionella israelensis]KTD14708.1 MutT/nudix family transporter protein [Legionella israelensis]QBS10975.1 CoA pyrophosphatase [Legionella israelensis]SCY30234.1 NUDIX domain-containing protein [Legionella israelensis DSM 19235]STX57969.1 MutT/nudix family transporter protein [Legionella israelensis]
MDFNRIPAYRTESAVIVLHEQSSDCLILTRRSMNLRIQPGHVCFPGGLRESKDENLYATALRELEEELGIQPSRVTFVCELEKDKTLFLAVVSPWLARIESIEPYEMNKDEVSELIKIPLERVINQKNYTERKMKKDGFVFSTLVFTASEHFIWGVTARIMKQLSESDFL